MSTITSVRKRVRRAVQQRRYAREADRVFADPAAFERASKVRDDGETVLTTRDGLNIAVRHNRWDARIVEEQFFDRSYLLDVDLAAVEAPVVVDIGGYIGDFTLYCAHTFGARVVVYEPAAENYAMTVKNIGLNPGMADRVTAVNKGVSSRPTITSNVQTDGREIHVSSIKYADDPDAEQRTFECDSLTGVLDGHGLDRVDLLKVDCEGGEYDLFTDVPAETYARIGAIVFEFHRVGDWETELARIEAPMKAAGFTLRHRGQLAYANRP